MAISSTLLNQISNNLIVGTLDLSRQSLTDTDAEALATALKQNTSLTILNLGMNQIGNVGAQALAPVIQNSLVIHSSLAIFP